LTKSEHKSASNAGGVQLARQVQCRTAHAPLPKTRRQREELEVMAAVFLQIEQKMLMRAAEVGLDGGDAKSPRAAHSVTR
jgi:hypothetical protein